MRPDPPSFATPSKIRSCDRPDNPNRVTAFSRSFSPSAEIAQWFESSSEPSAHCCKFVFSPLCREKMKKVKIPMEILKVENFGTNSPATSLKATCWWRLNATAIRLATTSRHGENARKQTGLRSWKQPLAYRRCWLPKESPRTKFSRTASNDAEPSVGDERRVRNNRTSKMS